MPSARSGIRAHERRCTHAPYRQRRPGGLPTWTTTREWSSSTVATQPTTRENTCFFPRQRDATSLYQALIPLAPFEGFFCPQHRKTVVVRLPFPAGRQTAPGPCLPHVRRRCRHAQAVEISKAASAKPCWSFLPTDLPRVHPATRTSPLTGGESLVSSKGFPVDRSLIKSMMPSLVAGHVLATCGRSSTACSMISRCPQRWASPSTPTLRRQGGRRDRRCHRRQAQTFEFAVLDPSLVTHGSCRSAPRSCQPYARRRFDGLRADTPEVITGDFGRHAVHHHRAHPRLGAGKLPIPAAVHGVGPAHRAVGGDAGPDRFGASPHAGGCRCPRLHLGRSTPSKIIETRRRSASGFSTAKFEGRVTILCDRGGDTAMVELLRQNGESVGRSIGTTGVFRHARRSAGGIIDDGRWRGSTMSILDAKAARKRQAVPA